jgi:antitoxin component YwqK of YwqJK toxin-antitoxin module
MSIWTALFRQPLLKNICSLGCLLIPVVAFCQRSIESYYDYLWRETFADHARFYAITEHADSGWYTKIFYIGSMKLQMAGLYEDKENKVPNGMFYWVYPNGKFQTIGKYVHGKKEGNWQEYFSDGSLKDTRNYKNGNPSGTALSWYKNGMSKDSSQFDDNGNGIAFSWFDNGQPSAAGRYIEFNKKHGAWQYFHKNGKVSAVEAYDHGHLVSWKYFDETGSPVTDTSLVNKEAEFPGGEKAWGKYLSSVLHFPADLELQNSEFAVVVISSTLNEEGKVIDAEVKVPFHPRFDEIALNAIKKSPAWIPAVEHNRKVYYHFTQSVSFSQGFR